jgi:hypothetical protein
MPDEVNTPPDEFLLAALIDESGWDEAAVKSAKLRSAQQRALDALAARRKEVENIYERAIAPDSEWQEITKVAEMVGEWGCIAAEKLRPQIEALRQKLGTDGPRMPRESQQARRDSIEIAETWLTLYCDLRERLLKLAAQRRPADTILRARPVEGEIDHAELTGEIIRRFPKILAELAK